MDFKKAEALALKEGLKLGDELSVDLVRLWCGVTLWTEPYLVTGKHNKHVQNFGMENDKAYFVYDCRAHPIEGFGKFRENLKIDKK